MADEKTGEKKTQAPAKKTAAKKTAAKKTTSGRALLARGKGGGKHKGSGKRGTDPVLTPGQLSGLAGGPTQDDLNPAFGGPQD
jgi:hypothetical protein